MGAQIASCGRCVGPQGRRRHRDGGFCEYPPCAGLPAGVAEAEQDPVGGAAGDLEVLVAFQLLLQTFEGLGGTVVLQAEDDVGVTLLPDAEAVGPGDLVEVGSAVALRPPQRQSAVVPPSSFGHEGTEEGVGADQVGQALAAPEARAFSYCQWVLSGSLSCSAATTMAPSWSST